MGTKVYRIEQGEHYSASRFGLLLRGITGWQSSSSIAAICEFGPTCCERHAGDMTAWNKLLGLSFGLDHHQDSARFVWRRTGNNLIELAAYVYDEGCRLRPRTLGFVHLKQKFVASISLEKERYVFGLGKRVDGSIPEAPAKSVLAVPVDNIRRPLLYHKLYPYHGGRQPAPVAMGISIQEL